ncbi:RNA-binding S4 domain-containing protein [Teredinibacter waterburyi]|uniref:RNA-binding S4 domain-containing protein n=1 Tax=Teredinibacter waterburyi TaxID=1500538 RepID=UPI00165F7050|nr:S4 domain-containing protein [Teredinibacter waterburyi]
MNKVRIDKWLWAARFFKTRSLAKQAIDGGKIHLNGARVKASKDIEEGMTLQVRQGYDEREVLILALSDQRRGAPEAAKLYQETQASIEKRALYAAQRKSLGGQSAHTAGKPNPRERRLINQFKRDLNE